jgi:mono/diheme cytochrome c family protein
MQCRLAFMQAIAAAAILAGCGGDEGSAHEQMGTAAERTGDLTAGRLVFLGAGCGRCHTLAAAGTSGTIGPNLDEHLTEHEHGGDLLEFIEAQVRRGGRRMPGFESRLSEQEIADVVAFVAANAGR